MAAELIQTTKPTELSVGFLLFELYYCYQPTASKRMIVVLHLRSHSFPTADWLTEDSRVSGFYHLSFCLFSLPASLYFVIARGMPISVFSYQNAERMIAVPDFASLRTLIRPNSAAQGRTCAILHRLLGNPENTH